MADFDAIVVGSGMSGGWAAKELCERGLKVLVLERGRDIDPATDYTDMLDPWNKPNLDKVPAHELAEHYPVQGDVYAMRQSTKHFWVKDSEHPYETAPGTEFRWRRGYHVGGRSIMWGRQSYRMSEHDLDANKRDGHGVDWPIRYADLAPWYDTVEKFAGISGSDDGVPTLPSGKHMLPPFEMNCAETAFKRKFNTAYPDRHFIIGRVAHLTSEPTDEQSALGRGKCQARNHCFHGCSFGAYFSSNSATLPAADATGNMTLVTNAIVHGLDYDPATQRVTGVRVIDSLTKATTTYTSKVVFLNAGSIASAMILLQSASDAMPTGLANGSDQVGRNIMDHVGGVRVEGTVPGNLDKYVYGRRPTGGYLPRYRNYPDYDQDYTRGFAFQVYSYRGGWWHKRPGLGAEYKTAQNTPGTWRMMLDAFGEVLPDPNNRMTLSTTKTDKWGLPLMVADTRIGQNERKLMAAAHADAVEIMEACGLTNLHSVQHPDRDIAPLGQRIHEMGTARMGRDSKTSVLNKWNQAHQVPNLFITDGAAMTSGACQNPSLTYMALSARAAHHAADLLQSGGL